jgi:tight adherence protein C
VDAGHRRTDGVSIVVAAVGVAWGALAATAVLARAARCEVRARLMPRAQAGRGLTIPQLAIVRMLRAERHARRAAAALDRGLPPALDLLVVALGAGAPPQGAVDVAARWAPEAVAAPLRQVLVTTGLGGSFSDALEALRVAWPQLAPVAEVLTASARLGAPAAPALARLADEARAASRRRAEARARVLPVKLLFPLVFLVLPAFGLLTVVPALVSAMGRL